MLVVDTVFYALADLQIMSERVNVVAAESRENISTAPLGQIGVALLGVASSIGILAALTNLKNKTVIALAVVLFVITALATMGGDKGVATTF